MHKYVPCYCTVTAYKWFQTIHSTKRLSVYVDYLTKSKISNIYYGTQFITGNYLEYFLDKKSVKSSLSKFPNGISDLRTLITDIEAMHRKDSCVTLNSIPMFKDLIRSLTQFRYQLTDFCSNINDIERMRELALTLMNLIPSLSEFSDTYGPIIELTYKFFCNRIPEHCPITRMISQMIESLTTLLASAQHIILGNHSQTNTQVLYIKRLCQHMLSSGDVLTEDTIIRNYPKMELYDIITDVDIVNNDLKLMMKRNINGVPYRYDLIASNGSSFLIRGISRDDYSRDSLVDEYVSDESGDES